MAESEDVMADEVSLAEAALDEPDASASRDGQAAAVTTIGSPELTATAPAASPPVEAIGRDDHLFRHVGDYGIDAPHIVAAVSWLAVATLLTTVIAGIVNERPLMFACFGATAAITLVALVLVRSSRVGKVRGRIRIVDLLEVDGAQRVLDVGCGRGLLLVEMATRLERDDALAVGVDIWRARDQSRNHPEAVFENAVIEGVDELVEVCTADARALPYASETFDAVASRMALHHVAHFEGRLRAVREIDRVTAPGGRVILVDFLHTKGYEQALRACNWVEVTRSRLVWSVVPPVRYVTGRKPDTTEDRGDRPEIEGGAVLTAVEERASNEGDFGPVPWERVGADDADDEEVAEEHDEGRDEDGGDEDGDDEGRDEDGDEDGGDEDGDDDRDEEEGAGDEEEGADENRDEDGDDDRADVEDTPDD